MEVCIVPRPKRAEAGKYGESKQRYQFMLTETASEMLDTVAEELGITRSEVLERTIRCCGLQAAFKYNSETGECDLVREDDGKNNDD